MHPDVIILTVARVIAWVVAIGAFVVSIASLTTARTDVASHLSVSNGLLLSIAALVFVIATKGATRLERPSE